jgi:hypothetical protein
MTRVRGATVSAFFLIVLITAGAAAADIEQQIHRSFSVHPGGKLDLQTHSGSIDVRSHAAPTVEVRVNMKARTSDRRRAEQLFDELEIRFDQTTSGVTIETRRRGESSRWFGGFRGSELRVHYEIVVPAVYDVDLRTSGGSIAVHDLKGQVDARTSGGALRFGRIDGDVRGRTSGGTVSLKETTGTADIGTSGGSISIDRSLGDVRARTSGGSIAVREVRGSIDASTSGGSITASIHGQPRGGCRLSTSGGSITVSVDPAIAVDVDARTSGGRVSTNLPMTIQGDLSRTRLRGKLNGGGPELSLRTSGGSISIRPL